MLSITDMWGKCKSKAPRAITSYLLGWLLSQKTTNVGKDVDPEASRIGDKSQGGRDEACHWKWRSLHEGPGDFQEPTPAPWATLPCPPEAGAFFWKSWPRKSPEVQTWSTVASRAKAPDRKQRQWEKTLRCLLPPPLGHPRAPAWCLSTCRETHHHTHTQNSISF